MKELRVHVERAVRPVRASNRRKDRMREELLAHLAGVFEQERARLGDEDAALREALRRFGPAQELTRELQATVPRLERRVFMPLPSLGAMEELMARRDGESPRRHALRMAVAVTLGMTVLETVVMACAATAQGGPPGVARLLLFAGAATALFVGANALCFTLMGHVMHEALYKGGGGQRSWRRALLCAGAASVVGAISALGLARLINWQARVPVFTWSHWPAVLGIALGTPLGLILATILSAPDVRRRQQWTCLRIDG
jgi:hypothetical protein